MAKIKTRETVKDIRVLDKSAVAGERMKNAYIRTKNQSQNLMDDSQATPSEYAADKVQYVSEDLALDAGHAMSSGVKGGAKAGRKAIQQHREKKQQAATTEQSGGKPTANPVKTNVGNTAGSPSVSVEPKGEVRSHTKTQETLIYRSGQTYARESGKRIRQAERYTIKTADTAQHTVKQTAKSTGKATVKTAKGTVKTTQKTVKTAEQTSKAAIKTAEVTAKTAQKSAVASAKAARTAAQVARATAKAIAVTAKAAAKATVAAVKTIIAGTKALIAAIAAGGWVAVLVVVIICLIGLIVGSCFGIFFSSEDTGSDQTMQQVVQEINTNYLDRLDSIQADNSHDVVEMSGSRAVWQEVLAIYAVKTTTDPDNPQEVASITDEKKQLLEDIFWEMNEINFTTDTRTETEIIESDDGNGNIVEEEVEVTKTYLLITVSHKTADEMAELYCFTDDQKEQLAELLADENASLWTAVLYGISGQDDAIVAVALSQIGNVGGQPYWSWYGFGSRVEWCACFVSWCANECGYIDTGVIPKFAGCVNGSNWFKERGQWTDNAIEPTPGMIIFFDWEGDGETDHVGIVEKCENGIVYTVEGNSGDSCRQRQYAVGSSLIYGYGIPAY